jgi:hypothetical protein
MSNCYTPIQYRDKYLPIIEETLKSLRQLVSKHPDEHDDETRNIIKYAQHQKALINFYIKFDRDQSRPAYFSSQILPNGDVILYGEYDYIEQERLEALTKKQHLQNLKNKCQQHKDEC